MPARSMTRTDQPVQLRPQVVRLSVGAVITGWLFRRLARLTVLVVRSPAALATLALVNLGLVVWLSAGPVPVLASLGVAVLGLIGWRLRWPAGFEAHVWLRVRG